MDDKHGGTTPADQTKQGGGDSLPSTIVGFLVGALVGMALIGIVWLSASALAGDPAPTVVRYAAGPQDATPTASPAVHHSPSPLQGCRTTLHRIQPALRAVGPALSQWEVHVGAMNKLVVGAITLPQANAFWNQTRIDAHHNLNAFRAAAQKAAAGRASCPAPEDPGITDATPQLRSCVRRVAAEEHTLAVARTAIATWSRHVADMDMLRAGKMSPAQATRMWLSSWQEGVRQIREYRSALTAARGAGTC